MEDLGKKSKEELISLVNKLQDEIILLKSPNSFMDEIVNNPILNYFINFLPFPVYFSNGKNTIIKYNRVFASLMKIDGKNSNFIKYDELVHVVDDEVVEAIYNMDNYILEEKSEINVTLPIHSSDEEEHIFQLYTSLIAYNDEEIIAGILIEITEQVKLDEEMNSTIEELSLNKDLLEEKAHELVEITTKLELSEEKLKNAVAEKDKFFSIIAHDLKSPFTALLGFSEILVEEAEDLSMDEIKEFSSHLREAIVGLYKLLENLLTWSRLQRKKITKEIVLLDLTNLIDEIFSVLQANANQKKIKLETNLNFPFTLHADKMMIETIIRNLVANALKFTQEGGKISVIVEDEKNFVKVSVKDTGVGMPEKIKNRLFKIDDHVTTRGTNNEKGTGLGLILSKEFVEMHGGKIWVESEEGKGSTFIFTISKNQST